MHKHKITLELDSYQISLICDWIAMAAENLHDSRSEWESDELSNRLTYGTTDYDEAQAKLDDILSQLKAAPQSQTASRLLETIALCCDEEIERSMRKAQRFQELGQSFKIKTQAAEEAMFRSTDRDAINKYGAQMNRYRRATERADYYYLSLLGHDPEFPHSWSLSTDELKKEITLLRQLKDCLGEGLPLLLTYYTFI